MIALPVIQQPGALDAKAFQAKCGEFSKAKDWKGLESLSRAQIAADPKDASAYAAVGFALIAENRIGEAQAACEQAIRLNRHETEAYIYLGLIHAQAGDRDAVLKNGQELAAAEPFAIDRYYKVQAIFQSVSKNPTEPVDIEPTPRPQVLPGAQVSYPVEAKFHHVQGTVALDVEVAEDGVPSLIDVLGGPKELVPAAIQTLKGFRYTPMLKDGHPIKFRTPAFFHFRIE